MARLGRGVQIGDFAIIYSGVTLHDNVVIRSGAVIGSPAEKHGYFTAEGLGVEIKEGTHVSEFVTIHSGIIRKTVVGKNCVLLTKAHLGHCVNVGDNCTISCAALIGGESTIEDGANIALNATLHQRSRIGKWAMVGMSAVVPKNQRILPGKIYVGNPAHAIGKNEIGLKRMNISDAELWREQEKYIFETPDWKHK
jgi:UDP-N-acetylglucosamine acyltransferase